MICSRCHGAHRIAISTGRDWRDRETYRYEPCTDCHIDRADLVDEGEECRDCEGAGNMSKRLYAGHFDLCLRCNGTGKTPRPEVRHRVPDEDAWVGAHDNIPDGDEAWVSELD